MEPERGRALLVVRLVRAEGAPHLLPTLHLGQQHAPAPGRRRRRDGGRDRGLAGPALPRDDQDAVAEQLVGPHFIRRLCHSPYLESRGVSPAVIAGYIPVLNFPTPGKLLASRVPPVPTG